MPILPCLSWISGCMCKQAVSLLFLTTFDPRFIIKTNQYPKESLIAVLQLLIIYSAAPANGSTPTKPSSGSLFSPESTSAHLKLVRSSRRHFPSVRGTKPAESEEKSEKNR
ncbi:hypothetical protein V3481_008062 [Fusarium oxysporum f. sp. vasinfectum]